MNLRTARCACGALEFIFRGDPVRVGLCHCHACQRRGGGPFGVQARFRKEQLLERKGTPRTWTRGGDDPGTVTFTFCGDCGSNVCWQPDGLPDHLVVAIGAFADRDFPAPTVSVYEERMHPWVKLPESVVDHFD